MHKEAFVYEWKNLTNGKSYIGYHKGSLDDGYICSSHNIDFWKDFNNIHMVWERIIIAEGTRDECLKIEQDILKNINIAEDKYYNNARGAEIIFTKSVLNKMSKSQKNRWEVISEVDKLKRNEKISKSKIGICRPKEVGEKLSQLYKGKTFIDRFGEEKAKEIGNKISNTNRGKKYHSEEYKNSLSLKMKGNQYGKLQKEESKQIKREKWKNNNPGKNKSENTKRKISESKKGKPSSLKGQKRKKIECPHCKKQGAEGLMQRWHFDNCKNK